MKVSVLLKYYTNIPFLSLVMRPKLSICQYFKQCHIQNIFKSKLDIDSLKADDPEPVVISICIMQVKDAGHVMSTEWCSGIEAFLRAFNSVNAGVGSVSLRFPQFFLKKKKLTLSFSQIKIHLKVKLGHQTFQPEFRWHSSLTQISSPSETTSCSCVC